MKTGILLVNLGTPDSPSVKDVRKYLNQFFSDPYVIDIHWIKRYLLKKLIILPFRSPKSAALYKEIWTDEGSPLMVHSVKLLEKLRTIMDKNHIVELGMGYGSPSIATASDKLIAQKPERIVVVPLFPQEASSTTGSVYAGVRKAFSKHNISEFERIDSFYDHPKFIDSWVERANNHNFLDYDHILFSYHGLPERHILKYDKGGCCLTEGCCNSINDKNAHCYRAQCYGTTKGIVEKLELSSDQYSVCFQSRLGKSPWIQPFADDRIIQLAKEGAKKLLVFAPSFVADCLETLHEIAIEYNELFREHGGESIVLVESLNSSDL